MSPSSRSDSSGWIVGRANLGPLAEKIPDNEKDLAVLNLDGTSENVQAIQDAVQQDGFALGLMAGHPDDRDLARLRNSCWPTGHLASVVTIDAGGSMASHTLSQHEELTGTLEEPLPQGRDQTLLLFASRATAMSPDTTRTKFDANAAGWNGNPGSPGYGHYRWMRRLIAELSGHQPGMRTLDAGCGTGWVGIEAALLGCDVSAFDPSPAMVELAQDNAKASGISLDAQVSFVEETPFSKPFDLVLNSGVISFAPDPEVYIDCLDQLVAPGGCLVIGDINPNSAGFRRRRQRRPLLPLRELSGLSRREVATLFQQRGYVVEKRWLYQLTFPLPEFMALCDSKGWGFPCQVMLSLNKLAVQIDALLGSWGEWLFDSWILKVRKPN